METVEQIQTKKQALEILIASLKDLDSSPDVISVADTQLQHLRKEEQELLAAMAGAPVEAGA